MTEAERAALAYVDANKDRLYQLLSELIQIPSVNGISHGDEAACVKILTREYEALGLTADVYTPDETPGVVTHPEYLPNRGTDLRPNVSAVWRGRKGAKSVMLAAHTDTMPIGDETLWTIPPFSGLIRDGRIYGRGSGDNKFGIAASIMAVKALRATGIRLAHNVVLTSYCDEEYGGGGGALAACLKYPCESYINLDGGNYALWTRAIGGCLHRCRFRAVEPQDSAALVLDAMEQVRAALRPFAARRRMELHEDPYFTESDMERSAFRILSYRAGDKGSDLDQGLLEFVYYTVQPKESVLAELSELYRSLSQTLDGIGVRMSDFEPTTRFFHCLGADETSPAVSLLQAAASEACGRPVMKTGACLTDLSLFLKCGSSASVDFGIFRDFKQYGGAHQPDEFVECEQFVQITKALVLFLLRWGEGSPA